LTALYVCVPAPVGSGVENGYNQITDTVYYLPRLRSEEKNCESSLPNVNGGARGAACGGRSTTARSVWHCLLLRRHRLVHPPPRPGRRRCAVGARRGDSGGLQAWLRERRVVTRPSASGWYIPSVGVPGTRIAACDHGVILIHPVQFRLAHPAGGPRH